jgi:hypothetical protein
MKNPISYIQEIQTPFVFSQGTIHPRSVHEKLNFVFCCGFFSLSSLGQDPNIVDVVSKWTEDRDYDDINDDQTAINNILATVLSPYPISMEKHFVESQVGKFTIFKQNLELNHTSSNLPFATLLPHFRFPRILLEPERSDWVVAHPLTPKNAGEKIDYLKLNKLWIAES